MAKFNAGDRVKIVHIVDVQDDNGNVLPPPFKIGDKGTVVRTYERDFERTGLENGYDIRIDRIAKYCARMLMYESELENA